MKTLLFTLEYPPFKGGIANYYGNLVNNWPEGEEISVLDNSENKLLAGRLWPKWLPAWRHMAVLDKRENFDHVLVGQLLPLGTILYFYSRLNKKKYSVIVHGMEIAFARKSRRKKTMARLILQNAEKIICASSFTADLVRGFCKLNIEDKIKVVNPGISEIPKVEKSEIDNIEKKYNLSEKTVLFSVSRLVKRKGQDKAITALKKIASENPNIHYYIAGTGEDEKYLREVAGENPQIHFLGAISDEEKWAWLMRADIFLMPARDIAGDCEGFGIVYLEAALAGKPAIAGASGGIPDAVINGETGILLDGENEDEIASAILKLAKDEVFRKKLGEQARARAIRDFSWKKQAREFFSIIN